LQVAVRDDPGRNSLDNDLANYAFLILAALLLGLAYTRHFLTLVSRARALKNDNWENFIFMNCFGFQLSELVSKEGR
jgi:hypothetical protein